MKDEKIHVLQDKSPSADDLGTQTDMASAIMLYLPDYFGLSMSGISVCSFVVKYVNICKIIVFLLKTLTHYVMEYLQYVNVHYFKSCHYVCMRASDYGCI